MIDRFSTYHERVVDDMFNRLVEQAAGSGLLDSTFRSDSTNIEALAWNNDASWNYDSTAEERTYWFGLTIIQQGQNPDCSGVFTGKKCLKRDGDA